jgi:hypothetical protein
MCAMVALTTQHNSSAIEELLMHIKICGTQHSHQRRERVQNIAVNPPECTTAKSVRLGQLHWHIGQERLCQSMGCLLQPFLCQQRQNVAKDS